jgi:hypothetical protein
MGGGKGGAPAAPDYGPIAAASRDAAAIQAQLGREQLDWAKQQDAMNRSLANKVVGSALDTQAVNSENAAYDRARYQDMYQPLENQAVADAQSYSSPERQRMEMGKAEATVNQTFNAQRQGALQNLESFGVDPTSTRYAALDRGMQINQAAASAAAGNQARMTTEAQGRALRSEAINVGRGYPGQVAQTYGTALQAGNQAINSSLATTQTGANTMGTAPQYFAGQTNNLNTWGNTLNMGYQNQLAQYNANQNSSSGWGSALGLAGGLLSAPQSSIMGGMLGFDEGGAIPDDGSQGGHVPVSASPSQGAVVDDVPARLTPGEFVLPKDVVQWKGEEWAQKEIQKAREARSKAQARPTMKAALPQAPTFASRSAGALPVG